MSIYLGYKHIYTLEDHLKNNKLFVLKNNKGNHPEARKKVVDNSLEARRIEAN